MDLFWEVCEWVEPDSESLAGSAMLAEERLQSALVAGAAEPAPADQSVLVHSVLKVQLHFAKQALQQQHQVHVHSVLKVQLYFAVKERLFSVENHERRHWVAAAGARASRAIFSRSRFVLGLCPRQH